MDKFQGQEAEAVIVSMATSGADDMPRDAAFLLSRNRFNVAISRARCLAILVASPGLLDIVARSVDEMRLANLFCWAEDYAAQQIAPDEAERQRRESQRNGRVAKVDLFQPEGDQCPGRDAGGSSPQ